MEQQLEKLKNKSQNKSSIYIKYAEEHVKYHLEYNTEKFVLLYQVGSFYEHYSWEVKGENLYLLDKISKRVSNILNMKRAYKNSKVPHSVNNPRMLGFQCSYKEKHLARLLEEEYIVVFISQRDDPSDPTGKAKLRDIVERYTPGTDPNNIKEDNYLMSIVLDKYKTNRKPLDLFENYSPILAPTQCTCQLV